MSVLTAGGFKAQLAPNDDLLIEGLASDFGLDRDGEAFLPGAIDPATLVGRPILYHHLPDFPMGAVLAASGGSDGVRIRACVPKPPERTEASVVWNLAARGYLKGLSVGGKFERAMTPEGRRIVKARIDEVSLTPLPVNPRTLFAVSGPGAKAIMAAAGELDGALGTLEAAEAALAKVDALLAADVKPQARAHALRRNAREVLAQLERLDAHAAEAARRERHERWRLEAERHRRAAARARNRARF